MFVAGIDAHATYSVIAIVSNTGQLVAGPIRIKNTQEDRLVFIQSSGRCLRERGSRPHNTGPLPAQPEGPVTEFAQKPVPLRALAISVVAIAVPALSSFLAPDEGHVQVAGLRIVARKRP